MKKYPTPSPASDVLQDKAGVVEFPVALEFNSRPPQIDSNVMLRRIAENMPWRNRLPGEPARRLAEKIRVEFEFKG